MSSPSSLRVGGLRPGSLSDWEGRLAAVIYTSGCNFRCPFCHNPELLDAAGGEEVEARDILDRLSGELSWLDGVVITGGEPTLQEGLEGFLTQLREEGLEVKLDTNGSRPEVLEGLLNRGLLDRVAMDVKSSPGGYPRAVGRELEIETIGRSIRLLLESPVEVEFRTTVVPGLVGEEEGEEIGSWVEGASRFSLQGFRPGTCLAEAMNRLAPPSPELMERLRRIIGKHVPACRIAGG